MRRISPLQSLRMPPGSFQSRLEQRGRPSEGGLTEPGRDPAGILGGRRVLDLDH